MLRKISLISIFLTLQVSAFETTLVGLRDLNRDGYFELMQAKENLPKLTLDCTSFFKEIVLFETPKQIFYIEEDECVDIYDYLNRSLGENGAVCLDYSKDFTELSFKDGACATVDE